MSATLFRNNARFASTIKYLRGTASIPQIESYSGPSSSTQSDVESSLDIPITDTIIDKYNEALNKLPARHLTRVPFSDRFLPVFARALAAGTDPQVLERADSIRDEATAWTDPNAIFLGRDLITNEPATAAEIMFPSTGLQRFLADTPHAAVKHLAFLASRHPAVTLQRPTPTTLVDVARLWTKNTCGFRTVVTAPEARIDPIAGVSTLADALDRAAALCAPATATQYSLATAWTILLANAFSAVHGDSPITSWAQNRHEFLAWAKKIPELLRPLQVSAVGNPIELSEEYIAPWARVYGVGHWGVRFELHANQLRWTAEQLDHPEPITATSGQLWLLRDAPESAPWVFKSCGIPNITFKAESDEVRLAVPTRSEITKPLMWCGQVGDGIQMFHTEATDTWQAVQIS